MEVLNLATQEKQNDVLAILSGGAKTKRMKVFDGVGVFRWVKPTGLKNVSVTVIAGGGGGGAETPSSGSASGSKGGPSSFGAYVSADGGGGGAPPSSREIIGGGKGGGNSKDGGTSEDGEPARYRGPVDQPYSQGGSSGFDYFGKGGRGGSAKYSDYTQYASGGGGGGSVINEDVNIENDDVITITVGTGGSVDPYLGGVEGNQGLVVIYWTE